MVPNFGELTPRTPVTIPVTINVLRDVTAQKLVRSVREKLLIPTVKRAAELKN
jgi:hypothetical protein